MNGTGPHWYPCRICALRTAAKLGWTLEDTPAVVAQPCRDPLTWNDRFKLADTGKGPMAEFTVYDEQTAPEQARPMLAGAKRRLGFVSTLSGVMAESPELLAGYNTLFEKFQASSLPAPAKHVVLITVSVVNGCAYCVAAHSTMALRADLDADTVAALRAGKSVDDPALEAVHAFTHAVVENRGWVDGEQVDAFLAAGYTRRHVLDVILGVGVKTLSNYTNHIAHTPLDPAWAAQEWTPPAE
jgi:AhpD family alkylhydroperoxidase